LPSVQNEIEPVFIRIEQKVTMETKNFVVDRLIDGNSTPRQGWLLPMNFHQTVNTLEAILWTAIGAAFFWQAIRAKEASARCWLACAAFLVFGISDLIEINTGAWWRPWWLFVMKAVCVLILTALYFNHRRSRRQSPPVAEE
jgi:hypothetical protein